MSLYMSRFLFWLIPGFALWFVGIILIITDYRREVLRWGAALTISCGFGYVAVFCTNYLHTGLTLLGMDFDKLAVGIMYTFSHQIPPLAILMFGITYSDVFRDKWSRIRLPATLLLSVPAVVMYFIMPIYPQYINSDLPGAWKYYFALTVWTVPYCTTANALLIYGAIKAKSLKVKRQMIFTCIAITPATMFGLFTNYILRCFGMQQVWHNNLFFIIPAVLIIIFAARYGILGYRLKYEKYYIPLELILDNISDGFIAINEDFNIIEVNKTFMDIFGVTSKDSSFTYALEANESLSKLKSKILSGLQTAKDIMESVKIEEYIERLDKHFMIEITPVKIDGAYSSTVIIFKDISEHKKIIELIKQNQKQLIEKERLLSLSQLIGGVAHNLKTPLLSSAGGIAIMKRDLDRINEYIEKNFGDVGPMKKWVGEMQTWQASIKEYLMYMSDVITAVKGQVSEFDENAEDIFSIKELIDKITFLMSFEFKKRKCIFVNEVEVDDAYTIKGDVNSLVQVFNNLMTNAIEASKEGERVILGAEKDGQYVVFYVKDFGEEILAEVKNRIFSAMVTTKGKKGTGLGLYISKSIVTGMFNGDIYFESKSTETTFYARIPLLEK